MWLGGLAALRETSQEYPSSTLACDSAISAIIYGALKFATPKAVHLKL